MAFTYNHLCRISITGLRFFTVYGSWGRPDMSPMLFANAIAKGEPIKVFNNGDMERDFTYVDDIVEGVYRITTNQTKITYRIMNIGNGAPVNLLKFIETLENAFEKKAEKIFMPMQAGDVKRTWAETIALEGITNYRPLTRLSTGIGHFADWYKHFYFAQE